MDYVSQLRLGDGAFGTVLFSDVPCLGWPRGEAPASRALADVATLGVRTVVLASDADPATPLTWARSVHMSLQKGSYVVTRGGGHVSFGRSPCATATVQRFLTEDVDTAANEESCTVEFVRYP
jgi:pimeloyl-ACP methyl ester carboxylesterase